MTSKTKILFLIALILIGSLLSVSALSIREVKSSPQEIAPGQTADISIRIRNIFNYDIENLNVKLDLIDSQKTPFAPYQSSSEKFLDKLDEDDDETFTFKLIALPSASSGIYKIPVIITYSDNNGTPQSKSETISLTVNSNAEIKIFLEDSSVLIRGKENKISLKVINSGLSDIKFAYLIVKDANGVKFLSEKEQYLGDINSDDFDTIDYSVYINPDAPSTTNIPVTLIYRDATNKEFSEDANLILKTYSMKEARGLGLAAKPNYLIYAGVVIVIGAYFIYRYRKKKKLKSLRE